MSTDRFVGEIRLFAGDFAPGGWALCQGQLLAVGQNVALYELLGTKYGGNGVTTFGLPDLRGRVPIHQGTAPSGTTHVLGEKGGEAQVTLERAHLPTHTHSVTASSAEATSRTAVGNVRAQLPRNGKAYSTDGGDTAMTTTQTSGESMPHENRQPFIALNYIIALDGQWPSKA